MHSFYERINDSLEALKDAGTYKKQRHITSPISGNIEVKGNSEKVILLCSNNYLGLANKEEIMNAGIKAFMNYGYGAASVRFICGTFDIHQILEEKLSRFLNMEASLTYTSCWDANTAVIPTILHAGDSVISDELNHASIVDGCRLTSKGVNKYIYKHANMVSLEEKLEAAPKSGTLLIITDGVFSMEGDIAPLPEIIKVAKKYNALVMVDDSHAIGVVGKTGKGTAEYYNLLEPPDIVTGTFGKALGGCAGGFVAGRRCLIDLLTQKSRPYLFSNALSPVVTKIAIASLEYLEANPGLVHSLHKKTEYMFDKLYQLGLNPIKSDSAIIPLIVGDTKNAIAISEEMMKRNVYVIGFGYPVVPEGAARIRIQLSNDLSYQDIDYAVEIIREVFKKTIQ